MRKAMVKITMTDEQERELMPLHNRIVELKRAAVLAQVIFKADKAILLATVITYDEFEMVAKVLGTNGVAIDIPANLPIDKS